MLKLVALALMTCVSCTAEAGVIFDNETPGATGGGYAVGLYPGSTNDWTIGFSFVVPSGANPELAGGSFVASFASGPDNDLNLSLETSSGGLPSTTLESWDLKNALGSYSAVIPFTSVLHPVLDGGQTYWLIASMVDPASTSYWWTPAASPTGGVEADSVNGGALYLQTLPSTYNLGAFAIYSVPEPATWAMTLVGLAAIGLGALTRRKQFAPADSIRRRQRFDVAEAA